MNYPLPGLFKYYWNNLVRNLFIIFAQFGKNLFMTQKKYRLPLHFTFIAICMHLFSSHSSELPNILWLTCEDMGPQLGCYGDSFATTPNLDKLAQKGIRYRTVWSTAPVCAPARTAIITGVYPWSVGGEHMRSMVKMPPFMKMYPQFLREKGYYCSNNNKEDYNVEKPGKVWDDSSAKAHWKNRPQGKPFFSIFNYTITHESQIRSRPHQLKHDPSKVRIPSYHPNTPEVRHDWAQYYDRITEMDERAGQALKELEEAGIADNTIVFFYSDHGSGMPRSKRFPYNSGLHVGLIIYVPEKFRHLAPPDYKPGGVSDRLIGFVDLAPTLLSIAGIKKPSWMEGSAFMGEYIDPPPKYLFGGRARMDERYDLIRSVRNNRYIYIRNYMPFLIYGQYIDYMFQTPTTRIWKKLFDEGKLSPPQTYFWQTKPPEELYDLDTDPDEVNNLVNSPQHQTILNELRNALKEHILKTCDVGFLTEPEMHARASATTIYEMARSKEKYPLHRILDMAERASNLKEDEIPYLIKGFDDPDSAVRYWSAMGLLMRQERGFNSGKQQLRKHISDLSPSVRIACAWALGLYGTETDLKVALDTLKELASPDKHGVYTALFALNAIDQLGAKAENLKEYLKTINPEDKTAPARMGEYVPRILSNLVKKETN